VRRACPIIGEIEIALHAIPALRYVAITGTNGKSTVTALTAHLLRGLGLDAVAAGNIGIPLSEVRLRDRRPDWVALEVSSFQFHDTPSINPVVGVVTNLSADHLDRYASVDEYYADKALLLPQRVRSLEVGAQRRRRLVMRLGRAAPADAASWRATRSSRSRGQGRVGARDHRARTLRGDTYPVSLTRREAERGTIASRVSSSC
jgi:UDP-N-acetylmuramoylalanine--D-glutamate ligase